MVRQEGYVFHPSRYTPELGHPQLDIYLASRPTGRFFDTHTAHFYFSDGHSVHKLLVHPPSPPWTGSRPRRICAGRISLQAHDGDAVEAYSLGGELEVHTEDDEIICCFRSPAPIFSLPDEPEALENVLVNEFEAQLAQQRAHWGANDRGYEARFVQADPLLLLAASLVTLRERLRQFPETFRAEQYQALNHAVHRAIHLLHDAGDWPATEPHLADLL